MSQEKKTQEISSNKEKVIKIQKTKNKNSTIVIIIINMKSRG